MKTDVRTAGFLDDALETVVYTTVRKVIAGLIGEDIPMLTLGIPGDAVTAVLISALTIQGLQPGPNLNDMI